MIHFHRATTAPSCDLNVNLVISIWLTRHQTIDLPQQTQSFQQWTKSEDLQKEKNRSLPASFGGLVIYGFMEGAPKRRAARATGTTHLTHTMNYYMQWSLAGLLPLKEIKWNKLLIQLFRQTWLTLPKNIKWLVDGVSRHFTADGNERVDLGSSHIFARFYCRSDGQYF